MSVLSEHITQMPSSSPLRESSSSEFCASSGGHEREAGAEASSRLAARLERSEYKRSRGKRLHKHKSSSSLLGKSKLSDDKTKRKFSAPAQLHSSDAENGPDEYIKQDWENHEKPFFETDQSQRWSVILGGSDEGHVSHSNFPARPQSWYGSSQSSKFIVSKTGPRSIHEVLPDNRPSEASSGTIRSIAKRPNAYTAELYKSRSLPHYFASNDLSKNALRNEHSASMSRSLSSSVSSHVGSMEERDAEHHGVYSAYDVASRSPYSGVAQRNFSQSSLSSSSASWNQSNPSLGYQTPKTSRESIHQSCHQGRTSDSHEYLERKSFAELSPVSEGGTYQYNNTNVSQRHENDIKPQEQNFSSSYSIRLTKVPTSSVPVLEQNITPVETGVSLPSELTVKPYTKQNPTQTAEKCIDISNKHSSKTFEEDDQSDAAAKVSAEVGVFQSQNHASFDPNHDSDGIAQKMSVTHMVPSEISFNQSLSFPSEYQKHNQDSYNASVTQAGDTTARFYQTPCTDNSDLKPSTSPSVKDLAKRFSGFEGHGDMRKVKAETWPKVVHVHNASYYENEVKKYTLHSENTVSYDASHKDVRDNASLSCCIKSNLETTNQHKANFVNTVERQTFIVRSADKSRRFESEENGTTSNNLKRKNSRDCEKDKPRGVTLQRLEFNKTEDSDVPVNDVYRKKKPRNMNSNEDRDPPKVPPRPKSYPAVTIKSDASHSTQDSVKSLDNSDGISHRLSLQELIRLHEDRIATHARSARASSHAQIYLKRPVSDLFQRRDSEEHCGDQRSGTNEQQGNTELLHINENNESASKQTENFSNTDEPQSPLSQYEIKEVQSTNGSPIKVIELSDKKKSSTDVGETRECSARVKRHRTIGIVGVRQQIDQATENKPCASKPKRHTAIGLVNLKDLKTDGNTTRQPVEEDTFTQTAVKDVQSSVQGTLEDLTDLTKDKRNCDKAEPKYTDHVEREKAEEIGEICVSRRDEHKISDQIETNQNFSPSLVTQDSHYQKQVSSFPSVTKPTQDIVIKQSSHHNYVTTSTHYNTEANSSPKRNITERDIYEEALSDENLIFGSTKPRSSSTQVPKHLPLDKQTSKPKPEESSNTYIVPKPYLSGKAIPIAQVSPVSPIQQVVLPLSENHMRRSPLSTASSAREMYEMRLALLNLVPSNGNHTPQEILDRRVPEDHYTLSASSRDQRPRRNEPFITAVHSGELRIDPRTEGLYFQLIDQLRRENHELRDKLDIEKREWKQKYDEQKKVANAYQKLEDRYRRRVHELQDALSNCTCQSFMVAKDSSILGTPTASEKLNEVGKTNINYGLHIIDELEEWITEQSRNAKTSNVSTSHDSLISSSTDFAGMGWDYSTFGASPGDTGQIDHVNGTHV